MTSQKDQKSCHHKKAPNAPNAPKTASKGGDGSNGLQVFAFQCLYYLFGPALPRKEVHQNQVKAQTKMQVLVVAVAKANNRRKQQRNLAITLLLFMIVETPFHVMISRK
eukprot:8436408-Ditylum_brightwellii.AAC.1